MTSSIPHQCSSRADIAGAHPLEVIPVFRRIPPSGLRDLVYTLIWNQMLALVFTVFNVAFGSEQSIVRTFWVISVFANCIGFLIHFEFLIGDRLLPGIHAKSLAVRTVYYSILPLAGVFAGYWLGAMILDYGSMRAWIFSARGAVSVAMFSLVISGVLLSIFIPRERAARLQADIEHEKARVAAAEKQAALAQLKLLEAQVEPHFLYNTLANVVSLVDTEPATAKAMIERLITLLRGASAAAGKADETLAAQVLHLRAYLELLTLRMGGRLAFRIDVPAMLAGVSIPPLLLQPLVENAIRHGLEPKVDGGMVAVTARRLEDLLEITVYDDGVGFAATKAAAPKGSGLGLRNLRERLVAIYGDKASIVIEDNVPSGARVTLRLPLASTP